MLKSMTGYGNRESKNTGGGGASAELRSSNHKYLEIVLHLPDGFLALEDKIKKIIEGKVKRGRVVCRLNISGGGLVEPCINRKLLERYLAALKGIQRSLRLTDDLTVSTLIGLPGVLTLDESWPQNRKKTWPELKGVLEGALDQLARTRKKEGAALCRHLRKEAQGMRSILGLLEAGFKRAIREKSAALKTDEERSAFQKTSDITEEIERLKFHVKNFISRLSKEGPAGKELDFIAQEMQRETNTAGAKSCDSLISRRVIQLKSRIEKIREQAQNVE